MGEFALETLVPTVVNPDAVALLAEESSVEGSLDEDADAEEESDDADEELATGAAAPPMTIEPADPDISPYV